MSNDTARVGSSVTVPLCPIGGEPLVLGSSGQVDSWSCPAGHGLAMTLSEGHVRLQDDEVSELWRLARAAPAGPLTSPFGRRQMVRFSLPFDDDEVPGAAPGSPEVILDVDVEEQFIWFDAGELDLLPEDVANAEPSPEELARVAQIRQQFGSDLEAGAAARDGRELSERIYRRLARQPAVLSTLDRVGRGLTSY